MAIRTTPDDVSPCLSAATAWIERCLIQDGSMLQPGAPLWTAENLHRVRNGYVDHPVYGADRFIDKLEQQMSP